MGLLPGRFPRPSNILFWDLCLESRQGVHSVEKLVQLLEALQTMVNNQQPVSQNRMKISISAPAPEVGESHSARKVRTLGCLSVFNLFTADLFTVLSIIITRLEE